MPLLFIFELLLESQDRAFVIQIHVSEIVLGPERLWQSRLHGYRLLLSPPTRK